MEPADYYQVGGSLTYNHHTYVVRQADRLLFELLNSGEYCFILNSRQMGKSSLKVRTGKQLKAQGIKCAFVDLTLMGSHVQPEQWYQGFASYLLSSLELDSELDFKTWWQQHQYLTELQRLQELIDSVLFLKISQKIVIFIEEVDSIIKIPFKDDFFAFIRACYNLRAENVEYNRLIFCLLGVATPADLIQDKLRTPFNIGRSIELTGFTFAEAKDALIPGLQQKVENPELILQQVLDWTGGQPFLTQKLCSLIVEHPETTPLNIQQLVEQSIVQNWEFHDKPEHLRTIRDRLLVDENRAIRLLGLYQQILAQSSITADESHEQTELRLSGIVVKNNSALQVYNLIYQAVFNPDWVKYQLNHLRPYSEAINHWLKSQRKPDYLLQGTGLTDARSWAVDKRLSDEDYQFLAASQAEQDRKSNQILTEANHKAKQMIRSGGIILGFTSVMAIIIAIMVSTFAEQKVKTAQNTIRLEKAGINALQQFESNQINGLISAWEATQDLKELVKNQHSLANYPTTSPLSALLYILTHISEQNQLEGHSQGVTTVTFSPDGIMASAGYDGTVKLWQRDGKLMKTLTHGGKLFAVSFSPNGKTIASASDDGTIKLWHSDGTLITTFKHGKSIYALSFHPKGKIIATGGWDNKVKLWKTDGTLMQTLTGHQGSVYAVSFSPKEEIIASGSSDGTIKLWKMDGTLLQTLIGHQGSVYAVSFSPDGNYIASGSQDQTVNLWRRNNGKLLKILTGHQDVINSVSFSPDGGTLASGSEDTTIKLWSDKLWKGKGKSIQPLTLNGHKGSVRSVSFSPDGKTLASGSFDKTIKLWNLENISIPKISGYKKLVTSVSFSPDGKTIASGSSDGTIELWQDGKQIKSIPTGDKLVTRVSFSPDGKRIVAILNEDTIKVYQTDGRAIATFSEKNSEVNSVSFSPDGKIIASSNSDRTVKLWKSNGTLIKTLTGHKTGVKSVSFSPDGNLVSGSSDGIMKLWKSDGTLFKTINGHDAGVTDITFSPDGRMFASSSMDGKVKVWEKEGTLITTFSEHNNPVTRVTFNADGQTIASLSSNGTIKLWKSDGTVISTITTGDTFTSISFSPDGQTLVAGSSNGLKLLSLDLDNLLGAGCTWLKDYLASKPVVGLCRAKD